MIRITRASTDSGQLVGIKIFINDVYRDKIGIGETKEFEVGNGWHTVYVRVDETGSNTLRVHVNNSIEELEVGDAVTGWKKFLWPYSHPFIGVDEHLFVREKEAEAPCSGANVE